MSFETARLDAGSGIRGTRRTDGTSCRTLGETRGGACASALQNHTSFAQALNKVQATTVNDMTESGFQVAGSS